MKSWSIKSSISARQPAQRSTTHRRGRARWSAVGAAAILVACASGGEGETTAPSETPPAPVTPTTVLPSQPGIFAAGDVTTVPFKQIVIAAGDGARAALGAFDHLVRLPALAPALAAQS